MKVQKFEYSCEEAKIELFDPDMTVEPGKFGVVPIPVWLVPVVTEAVAQYGPEVVALLKQAATNAIDALAAKFNITAK